MSSNRTAVIGAGFSGLSAAITSGGTSYEATGRVGGLCATYEVDGFRFELGGGHWLWGHNTTADALLATTATFRRYQRDAAVFFAGSGLIVPYPIQDNLWALDSATRSAALAEIEGSDGQTVGHLDTLDDWLQLRFGPTLHALFFGPFNDRYSAGLSTSVAPADPAKSPIDLDRVRSGATSSSSDAGYNASFRYPIGGLADVAEAFAQRADVRLHEPVQHIDTEARALLTSSGESHFDRIISTVGLHRTLALAEIDCGEPDPHSSVLVVNVGARRGPAMPPHQWFYVPDSIAGFHRVGCYSAIEPDFLPPNRRTSHVGLYVEYAFDAGARPDPRGETELVAATLEELTSWGWIGEVDVADVTWVEVGYTWTLPGSDWTTRAHRALSTASIEVAGRYARWAHDVRGQGILSSIADGLSVGTGPPSAAVDQN